MRIDIRVCSLTNNLALRMDECIGIDDDDDSVRFKVSSDYKMRSCYIDVDAV